MPERTRAFPRFFVVLLPANLSEALFPHSSTLDRTRKAGDLISYGRTGLEKLLFATMLTIDFSSYRAQAGDGRRKKAEKEEEKAEKFLGQFQVSSKRFILLSRPP